MVAFELPGYAYGHPTKAITFLESCKNRLEHLEPSIFDLGKSPCLITPLRSFLLSQSRFLGPAFVLSLRSCKNGKANSNIVRQVLEALNPGVPERAANCRGMPLVQIELERDLDAWRVIPFGPVPEQSVSRCCICAHCSTLRSAGCQSPISSRQMRCSQPAESMPR